MDIIQVKIKGHIYQGSPRTGDALLTTTSRQGPEAELLLRGSASQLLPSWTLTPLLRGGHLATHQMAPAETGTWGGQEA